METSGRSRARRSISVAIGLGRVADVLRVAPGGRFLTENSPEPAAFIMVNQPINMALGPRPAAIKIHSMPPSRGHRAVGTV
jgi:hypothetical protein